MPVILRAELRAVVVLFLVITMTVTVAVGGVSEAGSPFCVPDSRRQYKTSLWGAVRTE